MAQQTQPVPAVTPTPTPRIVVRHHHGRTWSAHTEGRGAGQAWGIALAALDYRAHATTDGTPPVFWLDVQAVRMLYLDCSTLGIVVEGYIGPVNG